MQKTRKRRQTVFALVSTSAMVLAGTVLVGPQPSAAGTAPAVTLGEHDHELLAQARKSGAKTVQVLVATKDEPSRAALDQLGDLGATIRYRADEVGYLRVEVPVDAVDKLTNVTGVQALDVDERFKPTGFGSDGIGTTGIGTPVPQSPPSKDTPADNPYLPTRDTGAARFTAANPAWDGRGVRIGILDFGLDLAHPALQKTSTGRPKVVDWVTATDGSFTAGTGNGDDPTWLHLTGSIPSDYRPPAGGTGFRFATFDEREPRLRGEIGNDVNRDGNPAGSTGTFGVAWDPATNTVWVDTNQNRDFTDDKPMTDYKVRHDVGTFGVDNPSTPVREAMAFAVQTSPANQSVNIGIVSSGHGTHVGGIAAGTRLLDGAMAGAAPGAQLVSVKACLPLGSCSSAAMLEGMIYAARDAQADVVNISLGLLLAVNDNDSARARLYDRLTAEYGVQIVASAGNEGSSANTVDDPATADSVLGVGAYISKDTWLSNHGNVMPNPDNLHPFSSRGPREDGGLKPDIVAPGTAVSSYVTWRPGSAVAGTFALPPGYATLNGTSMAAPQTAGAVALLVSAAKARKVPHEPAKLRKAITSTARYLPGYQAYEQGTGLLAVDRAWELLSKTINTSDISTAVPVNTVLADKLVKPGIGVGIHDREGVRAGDRFVRQYTVTRTTGPAGTVPYAVSWIGNDGTFAAARTISLPKGQPITFPVTVAPATKGIHSALLRLDDAATVGIDAQTLNTVVAADDFTAAGNHRLRYEGKVARSQAVHVFVRVPENAGSLKVDLEGGGSAPGAGQIRFVRYDPQGLAEETAYPGGGWCYTPPVPGWVCGGGTANSRTVADPIPGVWEINIENRSTSDAELAAYALTVSIAGARVTPQFQAIETARVGEPIVKQYMFQNLLGPFTGRATGSELGSARIARPVIRDRQTLEFPVTVPAGATQFRAKIGDPADVRADFYLDVFDCTSGSCVPAGQGYKEGYAAEEVVIANPAKGDWLVKVRGEDILSGQTTFSYLDTFTSPAFGTVEVDDTDAPRASGDNWAAPVRVKALAAPGAGRKLHGTVSVRTDAGLVLGTGELVIERVAP